MQGALALIGAPFFAEGEEVLIGAFHLNPLFQHPRPPFLLKYVHVPSRREATRVVMGIGRKAQRGEWQGQGAL